MGNNKFKTTLEEIEDLRFRRDSLRKDITNEDGKVVSIIEKMLIKEGVKFEYFFDTGYSYIKVFPSRINTEIHGRLYRENKNMFDVMYNFFSAPFAVSEKEDYSRVDVIIEAKYGNEEIKVNNFDYLNLRAYKKVKLKIDRMNEIGKKNLRDSF